MYGLLGKKLAHSFSVYIHEALSPSMHYQLYETDDVAAFLKSAPFKGLNVTIPYKQAVIDHLDTVDESVTITGVVNTIVKKDNKLHGYNTDYMALKNLVETHYPKNINARITILGNGATARSLLSVFKQKNYQNITICARNPKAGEHSLDAIPEDTQVLINATPVGMFPDVDGAFDIDFTPLNSLKLVHDLVYNPFNTRLIIAAKDHGIKTMNGLELLFTQAFYAQQHFGLSPKTDIHQLLNTFLKQFMNIVFIGLPFSGKSHYGRRLAKQSDKPFIDIDTLIEDRTGTSIKHLFMYKGEPYFREVEQTLVKEVARQHRQIIAPGGGVVLDHDTMVALKQNAFVIYLEMNDALIDNLTLKNRPLIKSKDDWHRLKQKREKLYKHYADTIIIKDTMDDAVILKKIEEALNAYFNH